MRVSTLSFIFSIFISLQRYQIKSSSTSFHTQKHAAFAFQLPSFDFPNPFMSQSKVSSSGDIPLEQELLATLKNYGRLENSNDVNSLVERLEQSQTSVDRPAIAPEVYGRWRLLHTTNTDTSSPIQRKAVDASKYKIYQDIIIVKEEKEPSETLVVSQVVKFGSNFELVVDALASTSAYPIAELTERQNTGEILGFLNVLGVSKVGEEAKEDPNRPESRINFVFDEGNFKLYDVFGRDWKIPYPVPFRSPLFRDAVKGWIDITYLSDNLRIARGNKGTTFILIKENENESNEEIE